MKIDQSVFVQDLVIKEQLTDYNANVIPMKTSSSIDISDLKDYEEIDLYIYQRLIKKLIYLRYDTRPDIAFVVGQLNRHNANPRKSYLWVAKRVVKYLKGIIKMGLIFSWESIELPFRDLLSYKLIGYVDSNFVGDSEYWKSVMSYYFFQNKAVVLWSSKRQRTVSISITKAQCIALRYAVRKTIWIMRFINERELEVIKNLMLYGDNKINIALLRMQRVGIK